VPKDKQDKRTTDEEDSPNINDYHPEAENIFDEDSENSLGVQNK
jgi:hypothetical protein